MALVKCPDCGRDVSSQAPACPGCGRPITPPVSLENVPLVPSAADPRQKSKFSRVQTPPPVLSYGSYEAERKATPWWKPSTRPAKIFLWLVGVIVALNILRSITEEKLTPEQEAKVVADNGATREKLDLDLAISVAVKAYLGNNLRDPASLKDLQRSSYETAPVRLDDYNGQVVLTEYTYRARNGFGGYDLERRLFLIKAKGAAGVVIGSASYSEATEWNALRALFKSRFWEKRPPPKRGPGKPSSAKS